MADSLFEYSAFYVSLRLTPIRAVSLAGLNILTCIRLTVTYSLLLFLGHYVFLFQQKCEVAYSSSSMYCDPELPYTIPFPCAARRTLRKDVGLLLKWIGSLCSVGFQFIKHTPPDPGHWTSKQARHEILVSHYNWKGTTLHDFYDRSLLGQVNSNRRQLEPLQSNSLHTTFDKVEVDFQHRIIQVCLKRHS